MFCIYVSIYLNILKWEWIFKLLSNNLITKLHSNLEKMIHRHIEKENLCFGLNKTEFTTS